MSEYLQFQKKLAFSYVDAGMMMMMMVVVVVVVVMVMMMMMMQRPASLRLVIQFMEHGEHRPWP
jgi:hypothetical protein